MIQYKVIASQDFKDVFNLIKSPFVKYPASLALTLHKFHLAFIQELHVLEFQMACIPKDLENKPEKIAADTLLANETKISRLPTSVWSAIEGKLDLTVDEAQILASIIEE